ncbi:MAG TPA: GNAT family N-acetyltransferase [Stenomitos sp.]
MDTQLNPPRRPELDLIPYRPEMAPDLLTVWHSAIGDRYPIMPALWETNTQGDPSFTPEDLLVAVQDGAIAGFALTKRFREEAVTCERYLSVGYLALMAVAPGVQRQGLGSRLLAAAEARLRDGGAEKVVLGGSFHHFMPGVPSNWAEARAFVAARGYAMGKDVCDVRRDLTSETPLPDVSELLAARPHVTIRPYQEGESNPLMKFLLSNFPGRWPRDVGYFLDHGGDIGQIMGLFVDGVPRGFAHLHPPGSPGARRWAGFNPAVSALGPIGVGKVVQGHGLGLALLVKGLEHLKALGATDTVIDWTDLIAFYGKCGFTPFQGYTLGEKGLR